MGIFANKMQMVTQRYSQHKGQKAIGIMGGMFDPVHTGHLRAAIEFAEALSLSEVRLLPCHQPPHKESPLVSSVQRREMLELAIRHADKLCVDDRELMLRNEPSYTISSLRQLRQELGDETPIYFALGADAFNKLDTWKDWKELFSLANFVVMHRPASEISFSNAFLQSRLSDIDSEHPVAGNIYELTISALDISSTKIRQLIQSDQSIKFMLPEVVEQYIYQNQLYR